MSQVKFKFYILGNFWEIQIDCHLQCTCTENAGDEVQPILLHASHWYAVGSPGFAEEAIRLDPVGQRRTTLFSNNLYRSVLGLVLPTEQLNVIFCPSVMGRGFKMASWTSLGLSAKSHHLCVCWKRKQIIIILWWIYTACPKKGVMVNHMEHLRDMDHKNEVVHLPLGKRV